MGKRGACFALSNNINSYTHHVSLQGKGKFNSKLIVFNYVFTIPLKILVYSIIQVVIKEGKQCEIHQI